MNTQEFEQYKTECRAKAITIDELSKNIIVTDDDSHINAKNAFNTMRELLDMVFVLTNQPIQDTQ